jgi:hypothetical protein
MKGLKMYDVTVMNLITFIKFVEPIEELIQMNQLDKALEVAKELDQVGFSVLIQNGKVIVRRQIEVSTE